MKPSPSLRAQLVLAMLACVVATVVLAFGAAMGLMRAEDLALTEQLTPAALIARADIAAGRLPDPAGYRVLVAAEQQAFGASGALDRPLLAGVAIVATLFGGGLAVLLARRLGRQLEAVSVAADQVAGGDLAARATLLDGAAGESRLLAENFNRMAAALQTFQRQTVESSAAIAHELRTPLAILLGRLEGIREGIFPSDSATIDALLRQVEALGRIIDDLAIVSLAAAGRLDCTPVAVDLAVIVSAMLDDLRPRLASSGLAIEADLRPAPARADPQRVRQLVLALADNVARHAVSGGVIRFESAIADDGATLRILDRGPGLPPGTANRLFEPFWRHDSSRSREAGGSGLGLSVVASLVAAQGGSVTAAPRPGGGAVFTVTLPTIA